jgi:hypothetical protein
MTTYEDGVSNVDIIHFLKNRTHYLCNGACGVTRRKSTTDASKVTCENCKRKLEWHLDKKLRYRRMYDSHVGRRVPFYITRSGKTAISMISGQKIKLCWKKRKLRQDVGIPTRLGRMRREIAALRKENRILRDSI